MYIIALKDDDGIVKYLRQDRNGTYMFAMCEPNVSFEREEVAINFIEYNSDKIKQCLSDKSKQLFIINKE